MATLKRRNLGTTVVQRPGATDDLGSPFGKYVIEKFSRVPGTGSIDVVTRGKYKYFRGRIYAKNKKGRKVRVEVTGKTEAEVTRKIKELAKSPARSDGKRLTIETFIEDTFLPAMKLSVRPKTYEGYESACRLDIVPELGSVKLAELTANNVVAWLKDLDATKPRARQRSFMVLKRALSFAVDDSEAALDRNPLANMKAPPAPRKPMYILSLPEVQKLLEAAEGTQWHAFIFTAIATSARRGELFGLRWQDANLKQGFLYIRQALGLAYDDETKSGFKRDLTDPKTDTAKRRIDLSTEAIAVLEAHREAQAGQPNPLGLVFPNSDGGFVHGSNFNRRVWQPLVTQAELPHIVFNSLRHVGNTLLAEQGVSLKLLQQRLGHSTPAVTLKIYSHVGATEGRRGAAIIGAMLSGEKRGKTRRTRQTSTRSGNEKSPPA